MNSNIICNYYTTEYESLLRTTEQLFKHKVLQSYLTNEQNFIMYELLNIGDYDEKLGYWKDLLDGVLKLNLTLVDNVTISETSAGNENENPAVDDDEFIKMDLLNLQERLLSDGFVAALSLKIRYCLWEQPLKIWLQNDFKDGILLKIFDDYKNVGFNDQDTDDDCYELLHDARYVIREPVTKQFEKASGEQVAPFTTIKVMSDKEDDENYDEDNYDEESDEGVNKQSSSESLSKDQRLVINISKDTLSLLSTDELNNDKKKIVSRFNNIYHTIEDDKTTVLGKLQLKEAEQRMEKNQRKRKREESDDDEDYDFSNQQNTQSNANNSNEASNQNLAEENEESQADGNNKLPSETEVLLLKEINNKKKKKKSNLDDKAGASNIQISHLLSTIEENRSKLQLTDQELKKLLTDVQKTGSKWASDQKIGQEELYEACEKVLNQLRSYGSYCQPFMNKVSKREAPNYYDIIKQPMDLNTVLRKFRNIRYQSKQEFVDDLNLIWKNCLTYNTDTKLLIRRDCSMMQKKAASLISTIPDITIRDRKDVEYDLYEEDEEEGKPNGGTKDLTKNDTQNSREEVGKKSSRKGAGKNRTLTKVDEFKIESTAHSEVDDTKQEADIKGEEQDYVAEDQNKLEVEDDNNNESEVDPKTKSEEAHHSDAEKERETDIEEEEDIENDDDDIIDDEDDVQDTGYLQMLNAEQLAFIDDAELTTWKNMTSNARSDILLNRSQLFNGNKLNPMAAALLRNNKKMKEDRQWLLDYVNELNLIQQKNSKNISSQQNNVSVDETHNDDDGSGYLEDVKIGTDNLFFLNEYNITSNLPPLPYNGINNSDLDNIENFIVKENLQKMKSSDEPATKSLFSKNRDIGISGDMNKNVKLIQEIRHICHKISLIRDLQNRQAAIIASANNPNTKNAAVIKAKVFKPSIFRKMDTDTQVDLDFISTLPTRNAEMDQNLIESLLFKINSKIAMDSGFESTERTAISTLNEISTTYINNLIKTIKLHKESTSNNTINDEMELLEISLLQNGISRPDMIYSYYEKNFLKKQKKLKDIKYKLNSFLKKLLRPSLKDLSERNFDDESSSYITGDFSNELTGDDFFGFKELGLDKEFNMMNKNIPLHLLAIQMTDVSSGSGVKSIKLEDKEMNLTFKDLHVSDLKSDSVVGLMKPCLQDQWELNQKVLNIKKDVFEALPLDEQANTIIKGDEELPLKLKAVRLATNGRISLMKKKNINSTILLPEEEPKEPKLIIGVPTKLNNDTITHSPVHDRDQLFLPTLVSNNMQSHGLVVPKRE